MDWNIHWPNVAEAIIIAGILGAVGYLRAAYNRFKSMDNSLTHISLELQASLKLIDRHSTLLEEHQDLLDRHEVKFAHIEGKLDIE